MADVRVLVAYGSRNGGTAQIAAWIADELRQPGVSVHLRDVRHLDTLGNYDAVILGGAVYVRRWQRHARRFLRRHVQSLSQRRVWLFSSGPVDPDTVVPNNDVPASLRRLANKIGAHEHITFGGRLDVDAADWFARSLARRGMVGDFRDEPAVRTWAASIAATLEPPTPPANGRPVRG